MQNQTRIPISRRRSRRNGVWHDVYVDTEQEQHSRIAYITILVIFWWINEEHRFTLRSESCARCVQRVCFRLGYIKSKDSAFYRTGQVRKVQRGRKGYNSLHSWHRSYFEVIDLPTVVSRRHGHGAKEKTDKHTPVIKTTKGKVHTGTGQGSPEGEYMYSSTLALTSAQDWDGYSKQCSGRLTPRKKRPGTHCTGRWAGPRAGVDGCGKSRPQLEFGPQRVAIPSELYRSTFFWECTRFDAVTIFTLLALKSPCYE